MDASRCIALADNRRVGQVSAHGREPHGCARPQRGDSIPQTRDPWRVRTRKLARRVDDGAALCVSPVDAILAALVTLTVALSVSYASMVDAVVFGGVL